MAEQDYQSLLYSLCRARGWTDPEYATSYRMPFYWSTVTAFNHLFRGDQSKDSDESKETAARRAYNYLHDLYTGPS